MLLLRFTALDGLPLRITSHWGKLLLRFIHEITGIELIIERIGHASVHERGKSQGKKVTGASTSVL